MYTRVCGLQDDRNTLGRGVRVGKKTRCVTEGDRRSGRALFSLW